MSNNRSAAIIPSLTDDIEDASCTRGAEKSAVIAKNETSSPGVNTPLIVAAPPIIRTNTVSIPDVNSPAPEAVTEILPDEATFLFNAFNFKILSLREMLSIPIFLIVSAHLILSITLL